MFALKRLQNLTYEELIQEERAEEIRKYGEAEPYL